MAVTTSSRTSTKAIDGIPSYRGGHPTSEISGFTTVLFHGVETTAGLTGTLFALLAENFDQRALLQADPSPSLGPLEEALRHLGSPLQLTVRTSSRDVTCMGSPFRPARGWSLRDRSRHKPR